MVVKVYNKSVVSNKFDTEQSLLEKIAMELNTIPKYLKLEPSDNPDEIVVDDILGDIYEKDFTQENKEILKATLLRYPIIIDELVQIWVSTVKFKQNIFGYRVQLIEEFLNSINYKGIDNVDRFLDIISTEIITSLSQKIEENKKRVRNTTKIFNSFDKFDQERERNELDIEKSLYEIKLDIPSETVSLLEIFNYTNTNIYVPFIGYKNYYKIYKSIPKSKGWETIPIPTLRSKKQLEELEEIEESSSIEDTSNMIKICVLKRNSPPAEEQSELVDIRNYYSIVVIELRDDGKYYMLLEHEILPSNVTNDGYINRVLSIFPNDMGVSEPNILKVTATFDIINQKFDSNIFSDLVFNNPIFSIFLTLKENVQTVKTRYSLVYNHPFYGSCVVSLTQRTITRQLAGQKAVTEPAVRIRVRNGNIRASEECALAFSKFFALYDIEKDKIIKFYKTYITSFTEKVLTIQDKDNEPLKLRDIVPDLFVGGTSRLCDTLPKIVSKEEAEALGEGRYMIYPKTPEEGPQYHYICEDDRLVPSLRDNPLSSKYKELPCCHQTLNPVFLKYYNIEGADRLDKQAKYQRLITTKKFLNPGQYGVIPDNLKSLFLFFDGFQNRNFGRAGLGIRSSKSSFLECIMKALKIGIFQNEDEELSDDEINLSIKTERLKLSKKAKETGICSQEFYNYTLDEMVKEIEDVDMYLDPRKTVKLLEEEYGCNIYIFTRNDNDAFMVIPNHIHGHLYYANKWEKTIILFDHNGSESDHATYNRCELISRWVSDKFNEGEIVFDTNDKFVLMISALYSEMARTYFGNEKITPFILPPNFENISSQYLDSYGKCRVLEINQNNTNFTLYCTPIPPLYTKRLNDIVIHRPTLEQVLEFCAENSMAITSLGVNDDNLVEEVNCIFDQIKFSIPIQSTDAIQGAIPLKTGLFYTYNKEKDVSSLTMFTKNRQNSRFVLEYSYWLFSNFLSEKNITSGTISNEIVKEFMKTKVKVDENFVYDKIARIFTLSNSSGIIKSGKLIVPNKELKQKIHYSLNLKVTQNPNLLISYKNRLSIKNYFNAVSEFEQNNKQVILNEGVVSFYTWSDYRFTNYKIYKSPTDEQNQYFYQNETVEDGKIQLVVNTDSVEKAAFVSNKWLEEGRVILPDNKSKTVDYVDNGLDYYYVKPNNDILQFNTSDDAQIKILSSALTTSKGALINIFD